METKICPQCNIEKPLSDFHINRTYINKDSELQVYYSLCKKCVIERATVWNKEHRERHRILSLNHFRANKIKYAENEKRWRKNNPDKIKARRKRDRLHRNLANKIYKCLRQGKNWRSWESLVGYKLSDLKSHLEKLFKPGMSWENWGEWHIDHKRPISSFNISSSEDEDFKECWSLNNLQPLWKHENLTKSSKFIRL